MDEIRILSSEEVVSLFPLPQFLQDVYVPVLGGIVSIASRVGGELINGYRGMSLADRAQFIGCFSDGRLIGLLVWEKLLWDSKVTGKSCARIFLVAGKEQKELLLMWKGEALKVGIEHASIRIVDWVDENEVSGVSAKKLKEILSVVTALEETGFSPLEEVYFFCMDMRDEAHSGLVVDGSSNSINGLSIRVANDGDRKSVGDIAERSFIYDRFHRDEFFSDEEADRVHRVWAEGSFDGRADMVLVAELEDGQTVGYCTGIVCELDSVVGWVDMIAVHSEYRGYGIGRRLLKEICSYFYNRGVTRIALSTQSTNSTAIRLYELFGFKHFGSARTYRSVLKV